MNTNRNFSHLFALPRLRIQNANTVSSPLTHGFPSMTAFTGLMWALERRARAEDREFSFRGVGVVCHHYEEQVSRKKSYATLNLTRNPVGKDGKAPPIVEEGRIHLETSLVFAIESERWKRDEELHAVDSRWLAEQVETMRIAGGTVLPHASPHLYRNRPHIVDLTGNEDDRKAVFRAFRSRLLPGFSLVSRDDLLDTRLAELKVEQAHATRLDAWLSLARFNWRGPSQKDNQPWTHDRAGAGWLVPIPVGYGALDKVRDGGSVAGARDQTTPFQLVESLFSIGEWKSPHRLEQPEQMIWYPETDKKTGRYRCKNDYRPTDDPFETLYDFD